MQYDPVWRAKWSCGRTAARRQCWNPVSPREHQSSPLAQATPGSDRGPGENQGPSLAPIRTEAPTSASSEQLSQPTSPGATKGSPEGLLHKGITFLPPFLAPHQLRPPQQRPVLRASPLRFALSPPTPPSGSSEIGGVRAGVRESPGRPLGWQPPGPSAVPGVVAAPRSRSGVRACPWLPACGILGRSRKDDED